MFAASAVSSHNCGFRRHGARLQSGSITKILLSVSSLGGVDKQVG
ncbi:hypothetical protein GFS60_01864 [Rhodococcus sp. WAY2]|nr:hypothetical protein GFS60_01864 [Rhodococcus sp. WAY2]